MPKLKTTDNYLLWLDNSDNPVGEYAKSKSVYREESDKFIIKESIDSGQMTILKSEVDAGDWLDADNADTPFTQATLRDFVQASTGFNPATGGSVAEFKATVFWNGSAPAISSIVKNDFGAPSIVSSGTGFYVLTLPGAGSAAFCLASPQNAQVVCDIFNNGVDEVGIEFFNRTTDAAQDTNAVAFVYVSL